MKILVLGIIITLIGAIISCVDKWERPNSTSYKKANIIALLTLLLTLIGSAITFYTGKEAIKEKINSDSSNKEKERENKIANDSIRVLNHQIHALALEQLDTSKTIVKLSQDLVASYKENAILETELRRYFNGGEMVPWLTILPGIDKITFLMLNAGKYPMWNVKVKCNEQQLPDIGVLPPGLSNRFFTQIMDPKAKEDIFDFVIWYNNGKSIEVTVYLKKEPNTHWDQTKIEYSDHNGVPFKHPLLNNLNSPPAFINKYKKNVYHPDLVY